VTKPQQNVPPAPVTVGDHTLEVDPILDFGYLTVTTDAKTITVTYRTVTATGSEPRDSVTVNLKTGKLAPMGGATPAAPAKRKK
jgi:hypothetical protein